MTGSQVTLEGYAFRGDVGVLGIVDSIMHPNTVAFRRFEYPSNLPVAVQEKMRAVAICLMRGLGYTHGLFNVEMMCDTRSGTVSVIEVNPRMSSQFVDLFEKVDGINTYEILLDLALDRTAGHPPSEREKRHVGTPAVNLPRLLWRRIELSRVRDMRTIHAQNSRQDVCIKRGA